MNNAKELNRLVNLSTGAQVVETLPPPTISAGIATGTANIAIPLTGTATPCKLVGIQARGGSAGASLNTKAVMFGNATRQMLMLAADSFSIVWIPVDDASKVYVVPTVTGEGVEWLAV